MQMSTNQFKLRLSLDIENFYLLSYIEFDVVAKIRITNSAKLTCQVCTIEKQNGWIIDSHIVTLNFV